MGTLKPLMDQNFLEYASYVIKDRAIPKVTDGLKPVQRRILYTMMKMDDGKFFKVANIIGETMKLHPHGDASIGDALVVLANKEYFIEKQGNFGNIFTGDPASAPRYIEARLTPLAKETLFNQEVTEFEDSYDGRTQEPLALPSKLPTILLLGAEGIAVGMSTSILPHNFVEVLNAQISYLKCQPIRLFPDFPTGGAMDVNLYQEGNGKVRVRAKLEIADDKTIIIQELPFGVTTESLINSIQDAVNKGKLKISDVINYTAEQVHIELKLPRGSNAQDLIKPLYAFSHCEVSISTNFLVIQDNKPVQMTIRSAIEACTENLVKILDLELQIQLEKLKQKEHDKRLELFFVSNKVYLLLEQSETYEQMIQKITKAMQQVQHELNRDINQEDIEKLLNIPIKRLSKFDHEKCKQELENLNVSIEQTLKDLKHIKAYTVQYIRGLLKKYGDLYSRKTQITNFDEINLKEVSASDKKVMWQPKDGYVGTAIKGKAQEIDKCSEYDRLFILHKDGRYKIIRVPEKLFVGKDVHTIEKVNPKTIYNLVYYTDKDQICYAKRFKVESYILDKEYKLFVQKPGAKVVYLSKGENIHIKVYFHPTARLRKLHELLAFDELAVKSISARGNRVSTKAVRKIKEVDPSKEIQEPLQMILETEDKKVLED